MPVVFVISDEWMLRAGIRAELRERGVKALGFDSAEDVGHALAGRETPSAIVLDANAGAASAPPIEQLVSRVPTVLIASHSTTMQPNSATKVLFRPVQISEIVQAVLELAHGLSA